ncbi:uncharacterized protein LOC108117377 [Drosophila eugracilis]|uniref:uncharacterized protein LOC108117377 n=1 Tax=Drosophila eugracilis TaxID=29029 RepID=UPI0007E7DB5B|nr:uncharacterized protein LOC108117377 [Drosophila eugracilis]
MEQAHTNREKVDNGDGSRETYPICNKHSLSKGCASINTSTNNRTEYNCIEINPHANGKPGWVYTITTTDMMDECASQGGEMDLIWAEAVTDTDTPRKSVLHARSYQHGRAHSDLSYLALGNMYIQYFGALIASAIGGDKSEGQFHV